MLKCVWLSIFLGFSVFNCIYALTTEEQRLSNLISKFKTKHVGFTLVDLQTQKKIIAINPEMLLNPASSTKIITAAVALKQLGVDYRFKTEFYTTDPIRQGTMSSPLYIKGYGDPSLVEEQIFVIANALKLKGIQKIHSIIIDNYYFDNQVRSENNGVGYSSDPYSAETSALSVNFNSIFVQARFDDQNTSAKKISISTPYPFQGLVLESEVTINSNSSNSKISLLRPEESSNRVIVQGSLNGKTTDAVGDYVNISQTHLHAGAVFKTIFEQVGIKVQEETVTRGEVPSSAKLVYTHHSKTLDAIVRDMNKYSNNFVADQLVKTLGAVVYKQTGTLENGCKVLANYLNDLGISNQEFKLYSGSGLNTRHMVSANSLSQVLTNAHKDFTIGAEFVESLSISGVDGTVKNRFKSEETRRKLRVKTGLLTGVQSLVGFVEAKDHRVYVFTVLVNKSPLSLQEVKDTLDDVGTQLVHYSGTL